MRLNANFTELIHRLSDRLKNNPSTRTSSKKKTAVIAISAVIALLAGFSASYIYLNKTNKTSKPVVRDMSGLHPTVPPVAGTPSTVSQAPVQQNNPVAGGQPQSPAVQTSATQEGKVAFTEKDPFKAEFMKRFAKQGELKKIDGDFIKKADATLPIVSEKTFVMPPQTKLPDIPPPSSVNTAEPQKQKPKIIVKGVYRFKGKTIAITDHGEITEGATVNDYIVKHIDIKGNIELEEKKGDVSK